MFYSFFIVFFSSPFSNYFCCYRTSFSFHMHSSFDLIYKHYSIYINLFIFFTDRIFS
nr:MAG TPA: hypothetical protein [Caudoviricetes sp.]